MLYVVLAGYQLVVIVFPLRPQNAQYVSLIGNWQIGQQINYLIEILNYFPNKRTGPN